MSSRIEYMAEATKVVKNFFGGALGAVTMGMSLRWETERELKRLEAKISKKDNKLTEEIQRSKEVEENLRQEIQRSKMAEENLRQEINKLKWFWNR